MATYTVTLNQEDRNELKSITEKGSHKRQKVLNALILLDCDRGEFQKNYSKNEEVSRILDIRE